MSADENNPHSASTWETEVKQHLPLVNPDRILISDMPPTGNTAASHLKFPHFLCLKVLWSQGTVGEFVLSDYVDQGSITRAKQQLEQEKAQAFLVNIGRKKYPDNSIFSLVHLYMDFVFRLNSQSDWLSVKVLLNPRREFYRATTPESPLRGGDPSVAGDTSPSPSSAMDIDTEMVDADLPPRPQSSASAGSAISGASTQPAGLPPAEPSDFAPAEDETIVNMAFVLLLNSLTESEIWLRTKGYRWLPNRDVTRIFKALALNGPTGPGRNSENKLLEARTDGCFRHTERNISAALLEVKPCVRRASKQRIEWQEGAQMASHIYKLLHLQTPPPPPEFGLLRCDKPGRKRRLLVSQDHAEIYITIAEYDAEYERYLGLHHTSSPPQSAAHSHAKANQGNGDDHSGFLMMKCYGPWRIDKAADVKHVCRALLALSFYLAK